jgi:hypothetical protein
MPPRKLPEFRPGRRLAAADLNDVAEAVRRLARITVGAGLSLEDGPTGPHIALTVGQPMWVKIGSGSGASYAWTEQIRSAGAWINGPRSGTTSADPAIESSGLATVPTNTIVLARRNVSGEILFESSSC